MPTDLQDKPGAIQQPDDVQSADTESRNQDAELLEVDEYPPTNGTDGESNVVDDEIESLVQAARAKASAPSSAQNGPIGYVSNARNASSRSDTFQFWAPAEETGVGVGSLVRHVGNAQNGQPPIETYAVVTGTQACTLGLDDYAVHVYEEDARPPLDSIVPAPSRRRPIVNYDAQVVASTQPLHRPVTSGPVYSVSAMEMAQLHGLDQEVWPGTEYLMLGFYEDAGGGFGILAEELGRVLGPKQGHIIASGLPGAGKTSLFLSFVMTLYSQLQSSDKESDHEQ